MGVSQPRDQTQVCCDSCTSRQILYHWTSWEVPYISICVNRERERERDRDRRTSGNGETCTTEQWCGEQQGPESQDSLGPSAPRTRRACAHSHHCWMSPPLFISVWCLEQAQLVHQDSNTSRTAPPQGGTAPLSPLPVPERRSLSGMTVYPFNRCRPNIKIFFSFVNG